MREAFEKSSVLRSRDLESCGIWRANLGKLVKMGVVERIGRGLYALPDAEIGENHTLAEIGKRVPKGTVCLISWEQSLLHILIEGALWNAQPGGGFFCSNESIPVVGRQFLPGGKRVRGHPLGTEKSSR